MIIRRSLRPDSDRLTHRDTASDQTCRRSVIRTCRSGSRASSHSEFRSRATGSHPESAQQHRKSRHSHSRHTGHRRTFPQLPDSVTHVCQIRIIRAHTSTMSTRSILHFRDAAVETNQEIRNVAPRLVFKNTRPAYKPGNAGYRKSYTRSHLKG